MKRLVEGNRPTCKNCIYVIDGDNFHLACHLRPLTDRLSNKTEFPIVYPSDFCSQGYWYVEGHHLPVPFVIALHSLNEMVREEEE